MTSVTCADCPGPRSVQELHAHIDYTFTFCIILQATNAGHNKHCHPLISEFDLEIFHVLQCAVARKIALIKRFVSVVVLWRSQCLTMHFSSINGSRRAYIPYTSI